MATFAIDGTTYTYPRTINYSRPVLSTAHVGAPIYGIYYEAVLTFPTMLASLWDDFAAKLMDGNAHTITLPHPITNTDTTFSSVYFEILTNDRDAGLYVYNGSVKVKRIYYNT